MEELRPRGGACPDATSPCPPLFAPSEWPFRPMDSHTPPVSLIRGVERARTVNEGEAMTPWILPLTIPALAIGFVWFPIGLTTLARFRRPRNLRCPETRGGVFVRPRLRDRFPGLQSSDARDQELLGLAGPSRMWSEVRRSDPIRHGGGPRRRVKVAGRPRLAGTSSGRSAMRVHAVTRPIPGTERRRSSVSHHAGVERTRVARS
jgi:hypothetical protein